MSDPAEAGLVLAEGTIPSARSIAAQLKQQLNNAVLAERARRGEVHTIEDTYPMHRSLARVAETCGEYERAFKAAGKEAEAIAQEELIDQVGEKDGIPNQGITVPDADGDVVVSLDIHNDHTFDDEAVITAVATVVLEALDVHNTLLEQVLEGAAELDPDDEDDRRVHEKLDTFLADLLVTAMGRLIECGKFTPQVTKVKPLVAELARLGLDSVAATVSSTHKVRPEFKGVKIKRKEPPKPRGTR